jgi:hypothetical protein
MMDRAADRSRLFPELAAFEVAAQVDPSVLGVLYGGSLGRGTFDRFSDLDIKVWLSEAASVGPEQLRRMLGRLGEIQFVHHENDTAMTGFVGPAWRRTDLVLLRRADLTPAPRFACLYVMKDTDGTLQRLVDESPTEVIEATLEQARETLEAVINGQIYLALHNARGSAWYAMGEVILCCRMLYELLARLRGRNAYGFRYVEELLTPEEQALLAAAWPAAPTREEVRRAAGALWSWTRYVWAEAERVLDRPLELRLDEAALHAAADRIYTW